MDHFNKILVPIDFTNISKKTVKYAISFGAKFDKIPQVLHVSTKPPEVYYRFFPDITGYLSAIEENTQNKLNEFVHAISPDIDGILRYGTVYQEVVQYVEDESVDLIIISARSHTYSTKQPLGTITRKIIRKAECPVLTVYGKRETANIRKILCPLDLSEPSYQGLEQAVSLARKFNAKVYLLHVIELHEFDKQGIKKYSSEEAFETLTDAFQREIKIPSEYEDVKIEKVIRRNMDAAAEIVYFASSENIDLITLTTHGRTYWPRVLLGSVTEKVAHIAPCPVLTVRLK
ncbi:hypothetical protein GF337_10540 [candidate division KSB1 bacterium]|nr:hypothetical protein [candidate division KSB1 bacterium]